MSDPEGTPPTAPAPPQPPPPPRPPPRLPQPSGAASSASRNVPTGRLLAGALLVLFGIGWLVEALGVADVPWDVVLPAALIALGGVVVVNARSGRSQGGLIALGLALTLVLTVGSAIDVPLTGGVGDRTFRPATLSVLRSDYGLAIGQLDLDLRDLPRSGPDVSRVVHVHLGIGQVVVHVRSGALIVEPAHAEVGQVIVFGRSNGGFNVDGGFQPKVPAGTPLLTIDVTVGLGELQVRRG
jgi:hypothetical protein